MQETKFRNFTLKYPTELYYEQEMPTVEEIEFWKEELAKRDCIKWGFSYHVEKQSFIASYTDRGGKTTDPNYCTTSFGSTALSAHQKLYVVVEIFGLREFGEDTARVNQEAVEGAISKQLFKLMGK